jgi:hypothetical protein
MWRGLWLLAFLAPLGCVNEPGLDVEFESPDAVDSKADSAGAGQVEIKVTLAERDASRAHQVFKLAQRSPSERQIYFFDTGDLTLNRAGVILRARRVKDDPDDTTVKIRPLTADDVAPEWLSRDGFKCEEDWVGAKHVPACSLTKAPDHAIANTVDGYDSVKRLFGDRQEEFLADYGSDVAWTQLWVLGPTDADVWKLKASGFPTKLTLEEWSWPDGKRLVEISTRTDAAGATALQQRLMTYLRGLGFTGATAGETKTQAALDYFTR